MHKISGDKRLVLYKGPAWHTLGTVVQERISAERALEIGDCDHDLLVLPLSLAYNGQDYDTGRVLIVRPAWPDDDQPRLFGVASDGYQILQPRATAQLLDQIVTPTFPVETVGMLGHGETLFFCFDLGADDVHGDPTHSYAMVTDTYDGSQTLRAITSRVRTVCWNTYSLAIRQAMTTIAVRHTGDFEANVRDAARLVTQMEAVRHGMLTTERTMAETPITAIGYADYLEKVYEPPQLPRVIQIVRSLEEFGQPITTSDAQRAATADKLYQAELARTQEYRAQATTYFERFNDEIAQRVLAGTVWGAFNSVTEQENRRAGRGNTPHAIVFGDRARTMEKAFVAATYLLN